MTADRDLLVQASRLYYELGETQSEVAARLGLTRPQVSRLLKRARAEGVVEIRIIDGTTAASPAADELTRSASPSMRSTWRPRSPARRT